MNIPGFETILNDLGFSQLEKRDYITTFKLVLPDFKNTGMKTDIHLYFNPLNNHLLITSLNHFPNKLLGSEKTIFSGRVEDEKEFKRLLEMLYIK